MAKSFNIGRLRRTFDIHHTMTGHLVISIWTLYQIVSTWRVMWRLFEVDLCTILANDIECLPKDRVQRFLKDDVIVLLRSALSYDEFNTLNWIVCLSGSIIHIDCHCTLSPTCNLELWAIGHAFDGEAYSCDVEISFINSFANNFKQLFKGTSDPVSCVFI